MDADPRLLDTLKAIEASVARLTVAVEQLAGLVDEALTARAVREAPRRRIRRRAAPRSG